MNETVRPKRSPAESRPRRDRSTARATRVRQVCFPWNYSLPHAYVYAMLIKKKPIVTATKMRSCIGHQYLSDSLSNRSQIAAVCRQNFLKKLPWSKTPGVRHLHQDARSRAPV